MFNLSAAIRAALAANPEFNLNGAKTWVKKNYKNIRFNESSFASGFYSYRRSLKDKATTHVVPQATQTQSPQTAINNITTRLAAAKALLSVCDDVELAKEFIDAANSLK